MLKAPHRRAKPSRCSPHILPRLKKCKMVAERVHVQLERQERPAATSAHRRGGTRVRVRLKGWWRYAAHPPDAVCRRAEPQAKSAGLRLRWLSVRQRPLLPRQPVPLVLQRLPRLLLLQPLRLLLLLLLLMLLRLRQRLPPLQLPRLPPLRRLRRLVLPLPMPVLLGRSSQGGGEGGSQELL